MERIERRTSQLALLAAVLFVCVISSLAAATPSQEADTILRTSGVKGGLIVHLGCDEGRLTAALHKDDRFLVQGLDTNPRDVQSAREHVRKRGLYGPVTVRQLSGAELPYVDRLVSLVVVEDPGEISREEILRVLSPGGVMCVRKDGGWEKTVKRQSSKTDDWPYFLHGPDNNAVSQDQLVGPPRSLQWVSGPKWARAHEQLASMSSCVTTAGRMFHIVDEAPRADIRFPSEWYLVARNAYNGVLLWRRKIGKWADHLRRFRSGPVHLPFRLVASEDRVFVTLGLSAPVSVLDAGTGETLHVIEDSEYTKQIIPHGGNLTLLIDRDMNRTEKIDSARRRGEYIPHTSRIMEVNAVTGEKLWEKKVEELVYPCMAFKNGRIFYQTTTKLACLNAEDGESAWQHELDPEIEVGSRKRSQNEVQWESPTVVVGDGIVYTADRQKIHAFATKDGKPLWSGPAFKGYNSPPDVFLYENSLWVRKKHGAYIEYDPLTGEKRREVPVEKGYMHVRCYRNKATPEHIVLGSSGVQFVNVDSGELTPHDWIRGTCQYGILPANGMLYIPPHSCACCMKTKLSGLYGLAGPRDPGEVAADRLEKGPAYDTSLGTASKGDWPTYRHDAKRSGLTEAKVTLSPEAKWKVNFDGEITSPVVAGGRCYVSVIGRNALYAIDSGTGEKLWSYTAGGRIDSPPTVYRSLVLFGCADGHVYALRAADGALVWRYRVAPSLRQVIAENQPESLWPIHGSVLVKDGVVVASAGRSSYLDGGIRVVRLNPKTGKKVSETTVYSRNAETGKQPKFEGRFEGIPGAKNDILSTDGESVYMRHMKLDLSKKQQARSAGESTHLFSPVGFLDDHWWHRGYWLLGDHYKSHWSGWWRAGNQMPAGRILAYNDSQVYGFGRDRYVPGNTGQWRGGEDYQLFAYDRDEASQNKDRNPQIRDLEYRWTRRVPLLVKALVVADDTMFIAGPPDAIEGQAKTGDERLQLRDAKEAVAAWKGKKGGVLCAVSCSNGEILSRNKLKSIPAFGGMAAAEGRLYISCEDGTLMCCGK